MAAPPEGGRANDAVLELLAETLSVPRSAVTLVSGHGARDKTIRLDGVAAAQVDARLAAAAASSSEDR